MDGSQDTSGDDVHFVNIAQRGAAPAQDEAQYFEKKEPFETATGRVIGVESNDFQIPELPSGQKLMFNILSTWGDPYYVGLMGIEVFDRHGHLIVLSSPEKQLWANPSDINVLPVYGTCLVSAIIAHVPTPTRTASYSTPPFMLIWMQRTTLGRWII